MALHVSPGNGAAVALYQSLGFAVDAAVPGYYRRRRRRTASDVGEGGDGDAVRMTLELGDGDGG